jgi:hypothetical protein
MVAENTAAHGATVDIVVPDGTPAAETIRAGWINKLLAVTITAFVFIVVMFCVRIFVDTLKSSPAITG